MAVDWIAVDWGSSRLRAWALDAGGEVRAEGASDAGAGGLGPDGFEPALLALAGRWLPEKGRARVMVCGMAGARQGWAEAGYAPVPAAPRAAAPARPRTRDPRLDVRILGGVSQTNPPDVMRGEETQIAGLLASEPGFDGVVCLPGTHSKWVHVTGGEIFHFLTCMTGEAYALLAERSVLRHTLTGPEGRDLPAFLDAADEAMTRPERVFARLFSLRAGALLSAEPDAPATLRARLSGWLIGLELAASRPYWLGRRVALVGAPGLTAHYRAALEAQGLAPEPLDAARLTLDGLRAAHAKLSET
ncbi:MAG: 2-dehydro-3-deoxygalactonokinase [Pseudomonadota bacterium]